MSLKEEIVSAIKQPREIAFRLGHKNVKSAMESSAASFIGTRIDANSKFFDRTHYDTEKHELTHDGKVYSVALDADSNLPSETIKFFTDGLISYYNYRALVDNCQTFYDVYERALTAEPTLDVVTLVGDAIAMEGDQSSSIKLDLLYLKNNTMGTLSQKAVGFENALFHIFGAYLSNDVAIQHFVEQVCKDFTDPAQKDLMESNIRSCLDRANERAGACQNIDNACDILIKNFSGVTHEDYVERLKNFRAQEESRLAGSLGVTNLGQLDTSADFGTYQAREEEALRYISLRRVQRTVDEIDAEIKTNKEQADRLAEDIRTEEQAIRDIMDTFTIDENTKNRSLAKHQKIIQQLQEERKPYIANLEQLQIERDVRTTPGLAGDARHPDTPSGSRIVTVTVNGETREVVNDTDAQVHIDSLNSQNRTLETSLVETDARAIATYGLLLYATNFDAMGGEIVQAVGVLDKIGRNPGDVTHNDEQIRQAISIANNLHILSQEEHTSGQTNFSSITTEYQDKIFEIAKKYGDSIPFEVLEKQISTLCRDETLFGGNNPFFGREFEILQQMKTSIERGNTLENAKKYDHLKWVMNHMEKKFSNPAYGKKMHDYYVKQKLIPCVKIKIGPVTYQLQEEYKPHTVMAQKPTVEPPPPPPPEKVTKTNFCREMKWALKREMEALNGSIAKGDIKDPNNPDIEFNKHYAELLQKCCAKFEYYASKPDAFEGYQDKLLAKIKSGAALTEEDYLMLRFCPKVNPMLADYKQQLDAAIASGDPNAVRGLMVGGKGRGDLMHGNSIFPSPLNEGLKSAILTVHNTSMEGGHFVISPLRADYPELLQGAMGEVASQLKIIMETEDYQKYKDFLTIKIIDGKVTITNDNYVSNGQVYSSNPYDKTSMEDRAPEHPSMDKIPGGEKVCMMDGDKLIETTVDEYRKSPQGDLIQVAPGVFAPQSQIAKINEMGIMGLRTNATIGKINIPKIEIQLDAGLEASAEASSSEAETDAAALREGIVPLEPSTPVDDGIPDADAGK